MTQQDDITQRVLTDAEIQALWDEACKDSPQAPGWNRHIRFARALLSKVSAPIADSTLPLEQALHELIDKIVPGLDTGDLVQDARRASTALSAALASAPVAVPPGWKLVPIEPTPEMEDAGCDVPCPQDGAPPPSTVYAAMIGAAPPAPGASAPVAGEAQPVGRVRHFNYSGVARNGFSQEAVLNDDAPTLPDGALLYAAPQASAEDEWKAAIRKFMDTAIPALAAIANVHTPDEIDALEAMPREPVIDQVRRLSQACEELSRQVRPERPKADKDGCTCPSGDGSLRHPCPAHPQGKAAAVEEGDAHV